MCKCGKCGDEPCKCKKNKSKTRNKEVLLLILGIVGLCILAYLIN